MVYYVVTRGDNMAIIIENGKYHMKGKIKRLNGSYYNYKRIIKGTTSKKKMIEIEKAFVKQYKDNEIYADINFKALCDEYMLSYNQVKESTKMTKEQDLKRPIEAFGKKSIVKIDYKSLQLFIHELERELAEKSVKKIFYALKSVFDYAVKHDYLLKNPMNKVVRTINRDKPKQEMLYWTTEQFNVFCENISEGKYFTFFNFLFYTGCRRGEALALTWNDIDLDTGAVVINKSVSFKIRPYTITSPKTKNSYRTITIPSNVLKLLRDEKARHKQIHGYNDECFVFGFYKPLDPENIRRALKNGVTLANKDKKEEMKIPLIRVHDFRHSHVSYLINNMSDKFTDFDIAKRVGDTVQTIHETYAHWYKAADKKIIEIMNGNEHKISKIEEIKKWKSLLAEGTITKKEFSIMKKEILGI